MESYRLLVCLVTPPPAMRLSGGAWASPRSAGVRSSTDCEIRLQRTSVAARRPLTIGVAAVSAIMMGANTANLMAEPQHLDVGWLATYEETGIQKWGLTGHPSVSRNKHMAMAHDG